MLGVWHTPSGSPTCTMLAVMHATKPDINATITKLWTCVIYMYLQVHEQNLPAALAYQTVPTSSAPWTGRPAGRWRRTRRYCPRTCTALRPPPPPRGWPASPGASASGAYSAPRSSGWSPSAGHAATQPAGPACPGQGASWWWWWTRLGLVSSGVGRTLLG